jgi:hypothetical protein
VLALHVSAVLLCYLCVCACVCVCVCLSCLCGNNCGSN